MRSASLKIIPLGGLGEIGMNCMVLEYEDEILVIDCGLLFSDLDCFGVEYIIPDFSYLRKRKEKIKGFLITHGHEDHIGALAFAFKAGIHAPIYASPFSSLLIRERLKVHGLLDLAEIRVFKIGDTFSFKHFTVSTVSVNHSIVDSAAFFIQTPFGRIIHTGDFKIDPTPFYGKKIDLELFSQAAQEGTLLLMSDSTNVEHRCESMSEKVIYQKFEELFVKAQGLTIVSLFASNISRIGQIFDLAQRLDKKVAIAGRAMDQNIQLGVESGYLKDIESTLIPLSQLHQYERHQVLVLSTGSQGESRSALTRIATGTHSNVQLQKGDLILLSSKFIPGNEKSIGKMINQLFKQGAEVLYEAIHEIHVSGHATRPELKKMIECTKPKFFIPIHGEYRHLVHHAALAKEAGIASEHIKIAVNGDLIELTQDSCEIVGHFEESRILVEGKEGKDLSKLILRERKQMGEKGIVFSLLVRNAETGQIISGPEIISKGLAEEEREKILVENAKNRVRRLIHAYQQGIKNKGPEKDLQEMIRIDLRRFFNQEIGKKPTVLPIILDL